MAILTFGNELKKCPLCEIFSVASLHLPSFETCSADAQHSPFRDSTQDFCRLESALSVLHAGISDNVLTGNQVWN